MKKGSNNFFKVIVQSRTYLNLVYLLLSLVLGIIYFVLVITGISLGIGLIITLIGIPILFLTLLLCRVIGNFERQQAKILLEVQIPFAQMKHKKKFWEQVKSYVNDSYTWKSLIYALIKFPMGIISFIVLIVALSVSLGFIATPVIYHLSNIGILQGDMCGGSEIICPLFNNYLGTIILGLFGILLLFVSLNITNGLAKISGLLAKSILERKK